MVTSWLSWQTKEAGAGTQTGSQRAERGSAAWEASPGQPPASIHKREGTSGPAPWASRAESPQAEQDLGGLD